VSETARRTDGRDGGLCPGGWVCAGQKVPGEVIVLPADRRPSKPVRPSWRAGDHGRTTSRGRVQLLSDWQSGDRDGEPEPDLRAVITRPRQGSTAGDRRLAQAQSGRRSTGGETAFERMMR